MTIQEIRTKVVELTKMADEFVTEITKDQNEKEAILTNRMKQFATLSEREKELTTQKDSFAKERVLFKKEQDALNEKQRRLELKQQDLDRKIAKVNELMSL